MIGKFFSRIIKEITPADTSPVTFNSSGTYNPRYGKTRVYVVGRGGSGTTIPGNPYDNSYTNSPYSISGNSYDNSYTNSPYSILGNSYDNSYTNSPYTNAAVYEPAVNGIVGYMVTNYSPIGYADYSGAPGSWTATVNGYSVYTMYNTLYPGRFYWTPPYSFYQSGWTESGTGPMPSPFQRTAPGTGAGTGYLPAVYTPGNPVSGNFVAGNSGTNPPTPVSGNFVAGNSGTNPPTPVSGNYVPGTTGIYATNYTTGTALNIFNITMPGGVGGIASEVSYQLVSSTPTYSTSPVQLTVPPGGYVTITFTP